MSVERAWPSLRNHTGRGWRFLTFCLVGASGILVDLATVVGALEAGAGVLAANVIGWSLAVSWNFTGNYLATYRRPAGSIAWLYSEYVGSRILSFIVRAAVVVVAIHWLTVEPLVATIAGIGAAVVVGFALAETVVFGGDLND